MTNRLIDCFEFEGELDLLNYRLDLLSNDVFYFIIFDNQDDFDKFEMLIKQKLTDKTKSIWYPRQERMDTESKRYE